MDNKKELTPSDLQALRNYIAEMDDLKDHEPEKDFTKKWAEAWVAWRTDCLALNEKYRNVIVKEIAACLVDDYWEDSPSSVAELVKFFLPEEGSLTPNFYNLPTSTAADMIMEVMIYGRNLEDIPERKNKISHSAEYSVFGKGSTRQLRKSGKKETYIVEVEDIEKFMGSSVPAKKLFVLTLVKANEQAVFDGILRRGFVTFSLQELVDLGFYANIKSARNGFWKGLNALSGIKIMGHDKGKTAQTGPSDHLVMLFVRGDIINNQCYIYLNPYMNWGSLLKFFTILPSYYFQLPNRAGDLLLYIFFLARQRTREIAERGYFTISFRAIQSRLNLPSEKGLNNPQRDIKQPIEEAIEQIEDKNSEQFQNADFSLLPIYDDYAPIAEFLNHGILRVSLKGDYARKFIQLDTESKQKAAKAKRRKERITEKAQTLAAAKAIEKQET